MSERAEKVFKWYIAIVILATAFFLIYSPFQFKDRELYWREADYAAMAGEIDFVLPLTLAHGKIIPQTYPLFPWLAGYMSRILGFDMAFSLRFISVASLAIIALLVWETGRRAAGPEAAMVGVATVISANVMIEKGLDGYPNMTALMFLFAAWLVWFTFGVVRSHWNKAWIYSSLLCGLSFYTIGWSAIVYFFFPLIFMRRPLTLWPKLKKPGFAVAVGIILFFILFWGIPRWSVGTDIPFKNNPLTRGLLDGYFKHIIEFPFDLVIRFLPWSIIAWPPFCVAFFPLDKNPIFSRFMRIIFISLFFLLWFSPVAGTRDMIILLPPLSILIGMNYWLLARRYALFYIRFLKFF
jgi:hypothetical protein